MSKPVFLFVAIMAILLVTLFNYSLVTQDGGNASRSYRGIGYIGSGLGGHK